ncbi:FAD:protein FMN transferase [Arsenicibacter rosenii]|uniref:FAD:protein FMN transferase n=1 Tax=Arsenicibacter rosenii TaxID=1750698 RepID=A0A1S2VHG0_9BACT|nr:FAD:protein FMN transferase [Arsenicibacter rosenii]OIN58172.1 thiamine biosynthesis protein ApbE [Arsenicibacter rosenii]
MKLTLTLLFSLLSLLPAIGQGHEAMRAGETMVSFSGEAQGTTYHITYHDTQRRQFKRQTDSLLADIDLALSTYRPDSEIMRFNRSGQHRFESVHFPAVLAKASALYRQTDGAFDPTIMPLADAYGFSAASKTATGAINVDSLLNYVGFSKITFDATTLRRQSAGVRLDLNAIAQGYSVDVVSLFLEQQGIRHYLVEIGGEIRAKGEKGPHQFWTIGIEHPLQRGLIYKTLRIRDRSMATSGNYRNRKEVNGLVMGHIINPKTGLSQPGLSQPGLSQPDPLVSATVFAGDAATADALATAFIVMGLEATQQFLNQRADLDAYLLYTDESGQLKRFSTKGLPEL